MRVITMMTRTLKLAVAALMGLAGSSLAANEPAPANEVITIWPGPPPGTEDWSGPETDTMLPIPGQQIRMISNVTTPTLTAFRPAAEAANGTAMIVVPGGGFMSLAIEHEGEMVARWLAERGVTAFVLKYRVRPNPDFTIPLDLRQNPQNFAAFMATFSRGIPFAVADATQALRYLRGHSGDFGIAPDRIGMIGFSAGAITTMGAVMNADPADRPDFAAPIYGAMQVGDVPADGPPLFIAVTQDDGAVPAPESIAIFTRWNAANLPAELHIYERGGHGFGMRTIGQPVDAWKDAFAAWLASHGWLEREGA